MFYRFSRSGLFILASIVWIAFACSCSTSKAKTSDAGGEKPAAGQTEEQVKAEDERSKGSKIKIDENSPADTVRVFYKSLREKKFREAMYLTNLRPAMEGLTDAELKEFQVDFNDLAARVPQEIEINGEIISADTAIVTANLPGDDPGKLEIQQIKLRRESSYWIILTVDEKAEAAIKKEGRNYFYALRIDTHESEAKKLLQKIADAQIMSTIQGGNYAEIPALVEKNFLPGDILSADSTGYNCKITLFNNGKGYFATATPAAYGKTGKSSFLLELGAKKVPHINSKDNGGQVMKK
jgi:hypothetical protein